jgi:hypothetical protein
MNEHLANTEPEPARQPFNDPVEPQPKGQSSRRPRVGALIHGAALLSTTALVVVLDPKIPPFRGD